MTPGLYVEFLVPDAEFDRGDFGETATARETNVGVTVVREQVDWLEFDGHGGVYARFVGAEDDAYMLEDGPVWRVVAE